jgi:hypothetical protein
MCRVIVAIFRDKTLISAIVLLLAVDILDILFLHPIVPELDILEHFLFGFALSELSYRTANSSGLQEWLTRKIRTKNSQSTNLLLRLTGFFLVGGLLWEASESFLFPMFGYTPNQFFSFPATLANMDGVVDVVVGAVGCFVAWYLARLRLSRG